MWTLGVKRNRSSGLRGLEGCGQNQWVQRVHQRFDWIPSCGQNQWVQRVHQRFDWIPSCGQNQWIQRVHQRFDFLPQQNVSPPWKFERFENPCYRQHGVSEYESMNLPRHWALKWTHPRDGWTSSWHTHNHTHTHTLTHSHTHTHTHTLFTVVDPDNDGAVTAVWGGSISTLNLISAPGTHTHTHT